MAKPKLFIGSSKASVDVARLIANRLEDDCSAEVTVWDEGIFTLNQGFLERLLDTIAEFDFAVLVWGADDITESKGESKASPRDNVIFECGLFMGALGRERVFIVHEKSVAIKIPSDFAGITLASYDGSRLSGSDAEAAIRRACEVITKEVRKPRFPSIVGEWTSRYVLSEDLGHPEVTEVVEIMEARGGVSIVSMDNPVGDNYVAYGRIVQERQIIGEWRARVGSGEGKGSFVLSITPKGNVIYGYNTAPDENNATVFTSWVLAKNDGSDQAKIKERLDWAHGKLRNSTFMPGNANAT
ncbi:nucleotide-binding protein [Alloacidobacterium sp.]|uniref:nucleotide-binding protein n=1 Tax=Alloacidobacterium sp. TaxID=2951999 RepID=UPI002D45783B|nr:nucleotide-binding protein [Alloacidobacterium sp.]HYK35316.1 nucleotide-binding protein [Alloacidobacterium sp.]